MDDHQNNWIKDYSLFNIKLPENDQSVFFTNKQIQAYLSQALTPTLAEQILQQWNESFVISLTRQGFVQAAERTQDKDSTHYNAIWVRDNIWSYHYFKHFQPESAAILIEKLFDYYNQKKQIERFEDIIAHKEKSQDKMAVPHIRFDGSSPTMEDIAEQGQPQVWHHRQMDAHGLFLLALEEAYHLGYWNEKIQKNFQAMIQRFFQFFECIDFFDYEDAGAWEEINKINTSSVALVTNACQKWLKLSQTLHFPIQAHLETLIKKGLERVKNQIALGGESPCYPQSDWRYREADAALLHVLTPFPLKGLDYFDYQKLLDTVLSLVRPMGVIRYVQDSYQSGNYWIKDVQEGMPTFTGDSSSTSAFEKRAQNIAENSQAQWFFDSMIALAYFEMEALFPEKIMPKDLKTQTAFHIKRALAQMTAPQALAADKSILEGNLFPESINTVILDGQRYYLPSPITPLNWAKASLSIALKTFIERFS